MKSEMISDDKVKQVVNPLYTHFTRISSTAVIRFFQGINPIHRPWRFHNFWLTHC